MAKEMPGVPLTTLAHHIDEDWLREAYRRTRKDGARGVDGQSASHYAEHLEDNLRALLGRALCSRGRAGTYCAPPVRRVHIPKADGSQTRPIGIPTFEDKVLQRAVAMVLEAVYEQEFHDFSYGFRPRRSAHQASQALQTAAVRMAGGWVLEVDVRKFFDTLDHGRLQTILRRRVRDGVILRLIGKWKRTAKDRFSRTLRRIGEWCRQHRHDDVEVQQRALARKLNGHYAYFGVTSNYAALARLWHETKAIWRKWLSRRSQKGFLDWLAMHRLLERFPLPRPRIVHRYAT